MTSKVLTLLALLVVSLGSSGCGGGAAEAGTETTVPSPPPTPANVWDSDLSLALPGNTILHVRANVDTLRSWHGWPQVLTIADAIRRREGVLSDAQWQTLSNGTHEVVFGGTFTDGRDRQDSEPLLFLRNDDANALLANAPNRESFGFRVAQDEGHYAVAALDGRTALFTDTMHIDANLERLRAGDSPTLWTNVALTQLRDALHGENAAATLLFIPPGIFRLVFWALANGQFGFDQPTSDAFSRMQALSARLEVGANLEATVYLDADSAQAATLLVTGFQSLIRNYAGNIAVTLMGLSPILNRIAVSASNARVTIHLSITNAEADALLSRATLFLGE